MDYGFVVVCECVDYESVWNDSFFLLGLFILNFFNDFFFHGNYWEMWENL
jgi:hypothetical protein